MALDSSLSTTGVWAIIVAARPGAPPTTGSLVGGLTDGTSLDNGDFDQAFSDFSGKSITVGDFGSNSYIWQTGAYSSSTIAEPITFDIRDGVDPGFTANTLWGLYWFPGLTLASPTLVGNFEVGGFAESTANALTSSDSGTTVPAGGALVTANLFDSNAWGDPTGLSEARFTAVAVPEPTSLALSALGLAALLRRRRH